MTGVERCFQYCDWVEKNPKTTNKYIKLAVKRFRNDLKRTEDPNCDFYFDETSANRFCTFAESLKMTKDDWSGRTIELAPWQCFFFCNIYGFRRKINGLYRFTTAFLFVGRKQGKAIDLTTPIHTPNGDMLFGDIHEGDLVYGDDGKPVKVLWESEVYTDKPCYEITFSNGDVIKACEDHLWNITSCDKMYKWKWQTRDTKSLYDEFIHLKARQGSHRFVVPTALPMDKLSKANRVYIYNIVPCDPVPCKCIAVDNESHLFCVGEHNTVTHNSMLISTMGIWDILATDGSEVSIVSNKREQSRRIFDDCVGFIQQNASLGKRLQIYQSTSKIINSRNRGVIEALSADKKNFDGKGCSVILADELGAMPNMSPIRILKSGSQGRKNPICVEITSGSQGTSNAGYTEWSRATKMLEGVFENDDSFFPMIFGVDEKDDPLTDESCWIKAMPMLDITTSKDLIRNQVKEAKVSSEIKSEVMCKMFCRWEKIANGWLSGSVISKVMDSQKDYTFKKDEPYVAVGAIDLSTRRDLTAWSIAIYQNGHFFLKHRFYYLADMEEEKTANADPKWKDWTSEGWLTKTSGNVIDLEVVLRDIRRDCEEYGIHEILIDPYGMYNSIVPSLQNEYDLIEVPQSTKHMSPRLKQFEEELHKGTVTCSSPVFRWMLGNSTVTTDSNSNIKIWKDGGKDSQKNIDGVITSTMAVSRLLEMKNEGLLDFRSAEERQKDIEDFLKNLTL